MNFLANPFQPVAGATRVTISRVQLPEAGRVLMFPDSQRSSTWVLPLAPVAGNQPRADMARHRAQYRAQCRAACMSKANF